MDSKWIIPISLLIIGIYINNAESSAESINPEWIISIDRESMNILNNALLNNSVEVGLCAYGDRHSRIIDYVEIEEYGAYDGVDFSCYDGTRFVGRIHTHPNKDCRFSKTDLFSFGRIYEITSNKPIFEGVMCGKDNLALVLVINESKVRYGDVRIIEQ